MGELAGVSRQGFINEYSPLVDRSSPQRGELQGTDRHARSLAGSQEPPVPAGRLERLKTFILSPIRALMAWVNRLLNRTEPSGASSNTADAADPKPLLSSLGKGSGSPVNSGNFTEPSGASSITPDAADPKPILSYLGKGSGSPVNRVNYELLVGEGGELNRLLEALEGLESIESHSGQAKELLGRVLLKDFTNGVTARDWAAGSKPAHDFVKGCGRMGIHLAHELNCWADSALKLIDAACAEIKLRDLYDTVVNAATGGAFSWPVRKEFFALMNTEIKGIERSISIGEWVRRAPSATEWLDTASESDRLLVTRQLVNWTKDASKHLDEADARTSGPDE